jgi:monoterpene epsilon-lactone hydrolase
MQSFKSRVLYHVVKYNLAKLAKLNLPLPEYRLAREEAAHRLFKMPGAIRVESARVGDCQGEWLHPETLSGRGRVLYLHGGAYTGGSCITHRALAVRFAVAANHAVFNLEYRLAPEHPFPAALEDATAAYLALHKENPDAPIAVAGDSAGAGLALALAISLRDQGHASPAALALMSPWTDLALTNPSHRTNAAVDPYFPTSARLQAAASHYAGTTRLDHHLVSPHYGRLHQLPPTLIHVGDREALLDDSLSLARNMQAHGSEVDIKVFRGMWHVWQTLCERMREADQSVAELGAFVCTRLK